MASKQTNLLGRTVVIDFNCYDLDRAHGDTRADKIKYACGESPLFAQLIPYDGQQAEIVGTDSGLFTLVMADGKLMESHAMSFSVLPRKPVKPVAWEYSVGEVDSSSFVQMTADLNAAGKDGWELIKSEIANDASTVLCIYKRPIVAK